MNKVISLVEALTPRARHVAEELAGRLPDAGLWSGYKAYEGLVGELQLADLLSFRRPREPHAVLVFRNPTMTGLKQVEWGDPNVLEANISQRSRAHILLDQPIVYDRTMQATFSETRTLQEQIKAGLEATIRVGVEAGAQGGIHGITAKVYAEIALKLYGEYQRQWGSVKTWSDTVTDSFKRTVTKDDLKDGPITINYEGIRSMNREERTVRADCDYEHSVELLDERQGIQPDNRPAIQLICPTWAAFRQVIQGFAPRDYKWEFEHEDGTKETFIERTAFYEEFIRAPLRGKELEAMSAPARGAIEMLIEYDNVLAQDIRIV